ncbi:hypothetical protein GQ55_6G162500 [Panicum hallii var. hallii]|uniref:Uncharacterized protein n=1 Tax=Panicum hallii var. hallii TaxID=1504633 RepID=A0A2T7D6J6_9POAL|nr:hypothetical protein GQ55_6G162500 [Panicum hallii var. hallii]
MRRGAWRGERAREQRDPCAEERRRAAGRRTPEMSAAWGGPRAGRNGTGACTGRAEPGCRAAGPRGARAAEKRWGAVGVRRRRRHRNPCAGPVCRAHRGEDERSEEESSRARSRRSSPAAELARTRSGQWWLAHGGRRWLSRES